MANELRVKGLSELQKLLDTLPAKLERNVMRGALRAGAAVILEQAQANVPVRTGALKKSLKLSTRARGGIVTASVRTNNFVARFVEFGTAAHIIQGRNGGWLNFGGVFAKSVHHPGVKPHPFLRPAMMTQATKAVIATAEYMKQRLASKEGLNTAGITISGEDAA